MKKTLKMSVLIFLGFIILAGTGIYIFTKTAPQFGASPKGARRARIESSPNFRSGKCINPVSTVMMQGVPALKGMFKFFSGVKNGTPPQPLPVKHISTEELISRPDSGLAVYWVGHSTVLIAIDGVLILTDPMLGNNPSPVSFMGTKRFYKTLPISAEDLPPLDAVLISHDHYDHLDYKTILTIKDKVKHFHMPLGIGAHLERWGVDPAKITEYDWGESGTIPGKITVTAEPTRHFSGRGLTDRFATQWCSWVIKSGSYSVYFCGDSGYFPGFKEIGKKHGPFDLTLMECGAYSIYWPSIHMMPEETVQAHIDLNGSVLMPIHWASFKLSIHPWNEPVIRLLKAAGERNVTVATPQIGGTVVIPGKIPQDHWWEKLSNN